MRKIFYREENLQIMGMSDGEVSMDFPYIETEENYFATSNMKIVREGDQVRLVVNQELPPEAQPQ